MSPRTCTILSIGVVGLFLLGGTPTASALPTPGLFNEPAEAATGRYFPEATQTNDYVGYFEAMDGLRLLQQNFPGWVTVKKAADSYGLNNLATQTRDTFDVPIIEVTNPDSPIPWENRVQILFMLSIHGNEKGGREGGLRIIEDFARNMGMATWTNQNGAGDGTYRDYLDYMTLLFLIPNADGWVHDEPQYLTGSAEVDPTDVESPVDTNCANGVVFYCRTNGRNVDLNREVPTMGWVRESHTPLSEPESLGFANFLLDNYHNLVAATDIHGMLMDENYVLTLLPAAAMTPHEMIQSTRLAEMLKERLNNDPYFAAWKQTWGAAELAGDTFSDTACQVHGDVCLGGSPTRLLGSTEINDWGTVWDTIGYVDSGFNGDFFAQNNGLNVPGFDIELAYNHLTFDSQYELGMYFNDLHVHSTRQIVAVFMDGMAQDLQTSIETHGTRTAVLGNPTVVTNADDDEALAGWASENPFDDAWDYANKDFFAAPQDYFRDLKPFLKNEDVPGVLDELNRVDMRPATLAKYDNLIIPGSAVETIANDTAAAEAIMAWVEGGGNLVLTDSALRFLEQADLAPAGAVDEMKEYAGFTNFYDRSHDLVANIRGISRQTYEPVPLGFSIQGDNAPNWYVTRDDAVEAIGWIGDDTRVNTGAYAVGSGTVRFVGALLPDPTEEFYHPYGLESYATTYTGNTLLRNFLGWEQVFSAPVAVVTDAGVLYTPPDDNAGTNGTGSTTGDDETTPGAGLPLVLALLGLAAVAARRRRA